MPFPGNPRIKILSGWRAVLFAASILAIIALLVFVAFSAMVIIIPFLLVGAVASLFFPKPEIVVFKRRGNADGVIEGDYKVVETSKIDPNLHPPDQSDVK